MPTSPPLEKPLTAEDVAELLGLHVKTVYRSAARGAIPSVKAGGRVLFFPSDLAAWRAAGGSRAVAS